MPTPHWLDLGGAASLLVYPPLGLALFLVLQGLKRRFAAERAVAWSVVFGGPLLLAVLRSLLGEWPPELLAACLVGIVAGASLVGRTAMLASGVLLALAGVTAAALLERHAASSTWHDLGQPNVTTERYLGMLEGRQELSGSAPRRSFSRFWELPASGDTTAVALEARLVDGQPGSAWFPYHPGFRIEPMTDERGSYTRVSTPEGHGSYITRRIATDRPIAGRSFRARLELRASERIRTGGCRGVLLSEVGGQYTRACLPVTLDEEWRRFELEWTPPPHAESPSIRVELRIPAPSFDVRGVELEELVDGRWVRLEPLEPTGARLRLVIPGADPLSWPSHGFLPEEAWQAYLFEFDDARLADLERLRTILEVEDGLLLQVRNVRLLASDGSVAVPAPSPPRAMLWYGHQNLAGHVLATGGLVALSLSGSTVASVAAAALTLVGIALTASRAAWLAVLIGIPWSLWLACGRPRCRWITATAVLLAAGLALFLAADSLGRLQLWRLEDGNSVSRLEIWRVALDSVENHPLLGLGEGGFTAAWQSTFPGDVREAPSHAHNFWLDMAATYGAPGLLASAWLTVGLLRLGWGRGRGRGLALLVPVLVMNVFDSTLLYGGVLLPLVLGLNALPRSTRHALGRQP